MEKQFRTDIAFDLAKAAAERTIDNAEETILHEKRRLGLINEAAIMECRARLKVLTDERDDLRALLRNHRDVPNARARWYYIAVAAVLFAAGVSFSHLALAPFGLGWQAWPWAVAIGLMCVAPAELALEHFGSPRVIGTIALFGFCLGVAGIVTLAHLRADVLALYLKLALSADGIQSGDAANFYQASVPQLRSLFALVAASIEIAAALMVWEARKTSSTPAAAVANAKEHLNVIEPEMARLVGQITLLENEPEIFEEEFLRGLYAGFMSASPASRRAIRRFREVAVAAIVGAALARMAHAQSMVIVDDFTGSGLVAKSADGTSEYDRNLEATATLLSRLPAGTRVSVMGITDASFSRPFALVSGQMPIEPGPLVFVNRIDVARAQLAARFKAATQGLRVTARSSDVIGSFFVASEIFRNAPMGKRSLVVFSDMRHSAPPLDIESPKILSTATSLRIVGANHLFADLRGVDVWILGVHAMGKDIGYMRSLEQFWTEYFAKTGARLRSFSMMRDLPNLTEGQ